MDQAQSLREKANKKRPQKIVTIASGKGGVGKSMLTVNLSVALARQGLKVLILDADFGLSNVDVMFGKAANYNISHFLRDEKTIPEIIQTGYEDVRYISGGSGAYELLNLSENDLTRLLSGIKELDTRMDYILCDVGAGIHENVVRVILSSSETIIVTTPEPTSVVNAYALIKTIVRHDPHHKIHILINKSESGDEADGVLKGFSEIVYKNLGKRLQTLGVAMYDSDVPKSIQNQKPLMVTDPDGTTGRAVRAVANRLLEQPPEKPSMGLMASIFSRVFKR